MQVSVVSGSSPRVQNHSVRHEWALQQMELEKLEIQMQKHEAAHLTSHNIQKLAQNRPKAQMQLKTRKRKQG